MESNKVDAASAAVVASATQPPPERPRKTEERTERSPEVQISDRARELRATARANQAQDAQPAKSAEPPAPSPRIESQPDPILAVRAGLAPVETLVKNPDALVREALEERAGLRRVGEVLERPEERPEAATLELPGAPNAGGAGARGGEPAAPPVELMGSGGGPTGQAARPVLFGSGETTPAAPTPHAPSERSERRETEEHEVVRGDDRDHLDRASVFAAHSGAVRSADAERSSGPESVDLPGEAERPAGEKIAERTLTQAGAVEAKAEEEIVSRYVANTPAQDPGAQPAPRQHLGTRAVPLSTYA